MALHSDQNSYLPVIMCTWNRIKELHKTIKLLETWKKFIHTHHNEIHNDFFDSWIAKHPRRTGEAYYNQYILGKIIDDNPIPRKKTLNEIWIWIQELIKVEKDISKTIPRRQQRTN